MFRLIYWVIEYVTPSGESWVHGIYTSIPNLIRHGLKRPAGVQLRLTLARLDSDNEPFGTWQEPEFDGLTTCLEEFVRTDEFSREQCQSLTEQLRQEQVAA